MIINLNGRIDSNNAAQVENDITEQLSGRDGAPVEIDASGLDTSGARVSFIDETKALRSELVESVNGSIEELDANSLREAERTRDALQTDFLSFKTATGTRIEG